MVDGKSDLEFTVQVDLMPDFELTDVSKLKIERLVGEVGDADVDDALARLAEQAKTFSPREPGEPAQSGDTVVIDFVGKIDGVEFPGGKAENFNLGLGTGQLIPGFEDQIVGAKPEETREVKVTFPADYPEATLAGKGRGVRGHGEGGQEARPHRRRRRACEEARHGGSRHAQGSCARSDQVRFRPRRPSAHEAPHPRRTRRDPFLRAAAGHGEQRVRRHLEAGRGELKREGKTAEDEGKSEDELKKEYREIAERRVRLGLVLARLGEQNGITVAPEEVQRAAAARARQFPGQEQQVLQFYAQNAQAAAELRAPIFEDKVVDFIAELADVTDRKVDRDTLFMDPDEAVEKLKAEKA